MTARRLPPRGKQFADARARGLIPRKLGLGHLVVLLDWREPSGAMPYIVIPPGTDLARGDGLDAAWPVFEREELRHAA
jgi:hypothetical protein